MAAKIEWDAIEDLVRDLVEEIDELIDAVKHQQDNYVGVPSEITGKIQALETTIRQFDNYLFEDEES